MDKTDSASTCTDSIRELFTVNGSELKVGISITTAPQSDAPMTASCAASAYSLAVLADVLALCAGSYASAATACDASSASVNSSLSKSHSSQGSFDGTYTACSLHNSGVRLIIRSYSFQKVAHASRTVCKFRSEEPTHSLYKRFVSLVCHV